MKIIDKYTENIIISSGKHEDECKYWLEHIGESIHPSQFPRENTGALPPRISSYNYQFPKDLSNKLFSVCNGSDHGVFIILITGVFYLLYEYTEKEDALVGVPLLKEDACKEYLNGVLAIKNLMDIESSFKDFVHRMKNAINKAYKNQVFPLGHVFSMLGLPLNDGKPVFRTIVLIESIHDKQCVNNEDASMLFEFAKRRNILLLSLKYDVSSYREETVKQIIKLLSEYLRVVLQNPGISLKDIDILSEADRAAYRNKIEKAKPDSMDGDISEDRISDRENSVAENMAPRNELEIEMAALWREVLGVENIGITNNFFTLGGDSIKAIRLAAMLWKYGVRVRDLYTYPTIAELAGNIKEVEHTITQEPVEGEVALTPIQRWFFEKELPNPSHYNQSVFIYKKEGFDADIVRDVFTGIIEHHDALRMTYALKDGSVKQYNRGPEKSRVDLTIMDISQQTDYSIKVNEEANKAHQSLDIEKGPLLKLVLFHTPEGDHLLIIIHHLVVDGISWRIIMEDFDRAYTQRTNGENIEFPQKTNSYKEWAESLLQYAQSEELRKEIDYWNGIKKTSIKALPRSEQSHEEKLKDRSDLPIILSEIETDKVKNASNTLNISMDSILLASVGLSLKEWMEQEKILVDLEGHGRQDVIDDINITRTVGWFTSLYPIILDSEGSVYIDCVRKVNDTLKNLPSKGFGYSILKYLAPLYQPDLPDLDFKADVCFNYLGEFDQDINTGLFNLSRLYSGSAVDGETPADYAFDINCIIVEQKLQVNINYSERQYAGQDIAMFAETCKKYILEIVNYALARENAYRNLPPKKLLEGIEPFNDIFYKDCFYNSFFAIAKYLNRNTDRFFANDSFVYSTRDDKSPLNVEVEYIVAEGLISQIEKCGIKTRTVISSNDIIRDIKMALAIDRPAIVRVDCYYESIRKDTYQKKHWPHMLLVYGYDDAEQVFNIIEHTDINGLDYSKKTIRYQELIQCYIGLQSNFIVGDSYPTFLEFYIEETDFQGESEAQYILLLAQNMIKNKDILLQRLDRIKTFTEDVNRVIFNEEELSQNIEHISFSLTNMLRIKYTEAYRNAKLLKDEAGIAETMNEIINLLRLAKNIVDKYKFSGVFREKSLIKVVDSLGHLYDLEYKYYDGLLSFLEQKSTSFEGRH